MTPKPPKFGDVVMVRGYVRYWVFCSMCKCPFIWDAKPDPKSSYQCADHERMPGPIRPPKSYGPSVQSDDGEGNSWDDAVGRMEDGRD